MSLWTANETEYLKINYEHYSLKEIAECLGKTRSAVQLKARRLGLAKKSKYYYDKTFFKEISTTVQAYWLGFIYADGYVYKEKGKPSTYSVGIELSEHDRSHLENFNKDIGGNVGIATRHRNSVYNGKSIVGDICSIRLYCSDMAIDLIDHGCCLNKTSIKQSPSKVPEKFMRDFIRGYFDGNGSISYRTKKDSGRRYLRATITTGSVDFAKWLSSYLLNAGFNNTIHMDGNNAYRVEILSANVKPFLDYIYKDSIRYLGRKYKQYLVAVCGG